MAKYTYNILYKSNPNKRGLSPSFKTIAEAKWYYIHSRDTKVECLNEQSENKGFDYFNDISEVVVYKNRKLHNYYDVDFLIKKDERVVLQDLTEAAMQVMFSYSNGVAR